MIFDIIAVVIPKIGMAPNRTREKLHPFVKANTRPEKVIEYASMIVPIFSPKAFCIAAVSLLILADNSEGFTVSNHALS